MPDHVDVLIVGAGVSGIGAACHLQARHPGRTYAILEARDAIGGTWDLFRFPGVRSDSDVHTFAYAFKPWTGDKAIVDGASIRAYVEETAREHGVDRHIRFGRRVVRASWSSETALWTVDVEGGSQMTARWFFCATGYYRYDGGYAPPMPGIEDFEGRVVHPQHWPEDLDHAGRRVVVIGSGATAVTVVPAMAETAAHVTMLQRSPSYILPQPSHDPLAAWLSGKLSAERAYAIVRRKNIAQQAAVYWLCQRFPRAMRKVIRHTTAKRLPPDCPVDVHFNPAYDPWDQRLCVVPDGDLFKALRKGTASVVTDHIATFTEHGIRLRSGAQLDADVVVTATGLELLAFGGIELVVDGREIALPETLAYRGTMLGGVPNFAYAIGYTNASWTLKVDLVCEYLCRVLSHLDAVGADACVPEPPGDVSTRPLLDFQAGYVLRALDRFPRQGEEAPWQLAMSYYGDARTLRRRPVDDGTLRCFSAVHTPAVAA
jgi:monooxygenase